MKSLLILSAVALLAACGGPEELATASSTPAEASMVAATAVNTATPPTPTPSPRPTATPEATALPTSPAAPVSPQPILTPEATADPSSVEDGRSAGATVKLVGVGKRWPALLHPANEASRVTWSDPGRFLCARL